MVIGDMPPPSLAGSLGPRGPFCMPLRMSSKPIDASPVDICRCPPRTKITYAYDGYKAVVRQDGAAHAAWELLSRLCYCNDRVTGGAACYRPDLSSWRGPAASAALLAACWRAQAARIGLLARARVIAGHRTLRSATDQFRRARSSCQRERACVRRRSIDLQQCGHRAGYSEECGYRGDGGSDRALRPARRGCGQSAERRWQCRGVARSPRGRTVLSGMVPFNVMALGDGRFHRATSGDIAIEPDQAEPRRGFRCQACRCARPATCRACNGASCYSISTTRSMRCRACRCASSSRSVHGGVAGRSDDGSAAGDARRRYRACVVDAGSAG